jgi:hypothetical protein
MDVAAWRAGIATALALPVIDSHPEHHAEQETHLAQTLLQELVTLWSGKGEEESFSEEEGELFEQTLCGLGQLSARISWETRGREVLYTRMNAVLEGKVDGGGAFAFMELFGAKGGAMNHVLTTRCVVCPLSLHHMHILRGRLQVPIPLTPPPPLPLCGVVRQVVLAQGYCTHLFKVRSVDLPDKQTMNVLVLPDTSESLPHPPPRL